MEGRILILLVIIFQFDLIENSLGATSSPQQQTGLIRVEWNNDINYLKSLTSTQLDQIRLVPRSHFSIVKDVFWSNIENFWIMYFGVDKSNTGVSSVNSTLGLQILDYLGTPVIVSILEPITYSEQKAEDIGISVVASSSSLYFVYGNFDATYPPNIYWIYRNSNSILSANIRLNSTKGKEGHTSHFYLPRVSPSPDGSVLIFGGYDGVNYYNQLGEFYILQGVAIVNFSLPTGPSPRAYHTSLITLNGVIWVFGGKNDTAYFNDLWNYNYYSQVWTNVPVSGNWPSARAGHSMLFGLLTSVINDESGFYVYGGDDGNNILSDFWVYNITLNTWTQIANPDATEPVPRAYHSGFSFYTSTNETYLIYFGGIGANNKTQSTFSTVDLYAPGCEISCPFTPGCVTYEYCYDNNRCDWNQNNRFQCGLNCSTQVTKPCSPKTDCTTYLCWNGKCADSIVDCDPVPFCGVGQKRCTDGTCVDPSVSCPPVTCNSGEMLCVDGQCRTQCPPYFGCLADDNPVMCGDGTCAATWADCNQNCTAPEIQCSYGCFNSCTLPDWAYNVFVQFQANNILPSPGQFAATGPYSAKQDVIGLYFTFNVNKSQTYTVSVESLTPEQLYSIGPSPYWYKEFDPAGLTGAWEIKYDTTAKPNEVTFDFAVAINSPEPQYKRNDSNYVRDRYCIAAPFLWYWDAQDVSDLSGLKDISYISEFRTFMKPFASGPFDPPSNLSFPGTPQLRWKCLTDAQFGWPVTVGVTQTEQLPRYGIHITVPKGVYALLYLPTKDIPPPAELPNMRDTNFGVLGFAAVILFVLLLIVGYKILVPHRT